MTKPEKMNNMNYTEAIKLIQEYNREYSKGDELIESIISCINYIIQDSENESKEDLIEYAEFVINDLINKQ